MAADAKLQYATTGGNMTFGIAAKIVGATAMAAISVATAGSLMKDVSSLASDINSLSKVSDISLNTSSQRSADAVSGRNAQYEGVGGCFIAGTKVKTADGEKNIEDVEIGDYVLAENPETGEQEYKKVVRTYIHEKTTLVHVFVGEEEIETTVEHPFYVEGIGFVAAGELRAGDIIRTSNGKNLPIDKVELELLEEPVLVYNFEVEDFHTYYVSGLGVLVHNDCPVESGNNSAKLRDTKNIRYSQNDIRGTFDDGTNINDLTYHLKNSPEYASSIEPIRLVKYNDLPTEVQEYLSKQGVSSSTVFSLDNRRLYAAKQAGVKVNSVWATQQDLKGINLLKRFSTLTGGKTIEVR